MKNKIIPILKYTILSLCNALYGFITAYFLPLILLIAFNKSKGNVNNPDGEVFMLIGWFILILIPILFLIINFIVVKKYFLSKKVLLISVGALLLGIIATMLIYAVYSTNYMDFIIDLLGYS